MPIIKRHQTPLDFVAQHAGALDGLFATAAVNDISITEEVEPGTELQVEVLDKKIIREFDLIDITTLININLVKPGGIGYMQIENDFKIK